MPEEFGKGAIEGVAGPEAANNAAVAGVLVPLLTLGLPTSATAAILLAAFEQYGLQPGPLLFVGNSTLVWGLIASLYIGNVMLLVLNLPLVGLWVRLLAIPQPLLYGGILVFSTLGVYSLNHQVFDLVILFVLGIVGYPDAAVRFSGGALHHRPDPRDRWPRSISAAPSASARATPACSSPIRSRRRCWWWRRSACWCR